MKNIIKKVSAIAMAAVLLSAGGAAAANTKSAKNNTITAHAAFCGAGNHRYNYSYSAYTAMMSIYAVNAAQEIRDLWLYIDNNTQSKAEQKMLRFF